VSQLLNSFMRIHVFLDVSGSWCFENCGSFTSTCFKAIQREAASGSGMAVEGYSVLHLLHWLISLNCIFLEGAGTVILWNTTSHSPNDTVSHPRRLSCSAALLWETHNSLHRPLYIPFIFSLGSHTCSWSLCLCSVLHLVG